MSRAWGKILTVYSPKGGVGKSTISANLAGSAFLMNKKVLLLDFDLFNGGLSLLIDEKIVKTLFSISDDLSNSRFKDIKDYIYKYNDGIDILCSPRDPRHANKFNPRYVEVILSKLKSMYDVIIIDTSSLLDELNLEILDNSDEILFVITNDIVNVKNIRNILNIFNDYEIDNYKIVINNSFQSIYPYFTYQEIRKIIGSSINYSFSKDAFFKDITAIYYENKIPVLYKNNRKKYKLYIEHMNNILNNLFDNTSRLVEVGEHNEEN